MVTPVTGSLPPYLAAGSNSIRRPRLEPLSDRAVEFFRLSLKYRQLLQKLENQLGLLVGLRQHRDTGLFQHLGLGQIRRFRGKVCILNGAARLAQILCSGLQVTDRGREAILDRAQLALERADRLQRRVRSE